jgi:paraquat-inducible protein A
LRCARCGAVLRRSQPDAFARALAHTVAAGVVYVVANAFPIVAISAAGRYAHANLFGAVVELWRQGMYLVAPLVLLATIVMPGLAIVATAYVLIRGRAPRPPAHLAEVLRLLRVIQPWAMTEVLLLGILVSLVKLGAYAHVIPGAALWAFAALVLITAATSQAFNPHEIWERIGTGGQHGRAQGEAVGAAGPVR